MTFLQLAQRLRSECGIAGTGPDTVIGQTGELARLVNWINAAYEDIQLARPDWKWMRTAKTFNTTAHKQSYHPTNASPDLAMTDFSHWRQDVDGWIYLTSSGKTSETYLQQIDYDAMRDLYLMGSGPTNYGPPVYFTVSPADKSIVLGPNPDGIYTITIEYFKAPQVLALDINVPTLPAEFHMMIIYRAMQKYGMFSAALEQVQQGEAEYNRLFAKLTIDQAPTISCGASFIR